MELPLNHLPPNKEPPLFITSSSYHPKVHFLFERESLAKHLISQYEEVILQNQHSVYSLWSSFIQEFCMLFLPSSRPPAEMAYIYIFLALESLSENEFELGLLIVLGCFSSHMAFW